MTLNGDKWRINIINVFVTIEGGASYFTIPEEETNGEIVRVINIGSAKSNFDTFDEEGIFL
jgi:hypothetical protein